MNACRRFALTLSLCGFGVGLGLLLDELDGEPCLDGLDLVAGVGVMVRSDLGVDDLRVAGGLDLSSSEGSD